ncbi:MAG: PilT/PilU family type 4a pilus ATPase [Myxococcales bacterium]|nr:PilT/PilU family type 4a pilus ATPase [Myxococcales bacterium]
MDNPYASREFFHQLLSKAVAAEASDIHLKVGKPPGVRVGGEIVYFKVESLGPEDTRALTELILGRQATPERMDTLLEHDTSYAVGGLGRFRVNVYRQRGTFAIAMRSIPVRVPTIEELGLPQAIEDLAETERGLVLVVGAAGNGKSTTLASMVHHINTTRSRHIVTIEDPIEFLHRDERSCVSQREVGIDTGSFASALRAALRQDPDVILVGEIRDGETMEIAVQAAETGHLVLSTMHTPDVSRSINRLLSLADNPIELRDRIADCMQGVVAQRLVPRIGGGLVLAQEILVCTGTVREAFKRPDSNPPLKELMEKGVTPYGMQTFQMALRGLVKDGHVSKETAHNYLGY